LASGIDHEVVDVKKRLTPWLVLLEKMVLGFADKGLLVSFAHLAAMGRTHREAGWMFVVDQLRESRAEMCASLQEYCDVTPENICVYSSGQRTPNVFSFLHLTVDSLVECHVRPLSAVWVLANFSHA